MATVKAETDIEAIKIGADTFRTDPLTRLAITTHSYSYIIPGPIGSTLGPSRDIRMRK